MNALLENDLSGMSTIQSFTSEDIEVARVGALSEAYRQANKKAIRLSAAFTPLIRMAILCGFTATLLLGGWYTIEGVLAVGAYSVLVFMTQRLLWPLTRLGETFDLYQRAMASSTRVLDVLTSEIEISQGDVKPDKDKIMKSDIKFQNVDFAYTNRDNTFTNLSLEILAGKTTGIVGSTGAGKTTLTRLLLRFAQPNGGSIVWGGCLLYTSPSPRDATLSRMPSSA